MNFRTVFNEKELSEVRKPIDYSSKIGLIGSCFVQNIGAKLAYYKFPHWINPYGVLFSPLAIERLLHDVMHRRQYTTRDLVFDKEHWHSLHHHSDFSALHPEDVVSKINTQIAQTAENLVSTTHLVITLGTAWVYRHLDRDEYVANCHKIPQKKFSKSLLSIAEIKESLTKSIQLLHAINPNLQIILTLSPVRHLKDGMLANSRSKAHLLSAIHQLLSDTNVSYFPSYELLVDDLRDYRFYATDMLHPDETAIDYIWHFFSNHWISKEAQVLMQEVEKVQKAMLHKPFNATSQQHLEFLEKLNTQKEQLYKKYGLQF